jgi:hypothetical protein
MRLSEYEIHISGLFNGYRFELHGSSHQIHLKREIGMPEDKMNWYTGKFTGFIFKHFTICPLFIRILSGGVPELFITSYHAIYIWLLII